MKHLLVLSLLCCGMPSAVQAQQAVPHTKKAVPAVQGRLVDLSRHPISPPFPDVPKDHWAYQAVEALRKAGVIVGEADGKFHG